jgi:hypothetical protein
MNVETSTIIAPDNRPMQVMSANAMAARISPIGRRGAGNGRVGAGAEALINSPPQTRQWYASASIAKLLEYAGKNLLR